MQVSSRWESLFVEMICLGNSLVVQWLRLRAFIATGLGLVPGLGTKMPQAALGGQKKKRSVY